MFDLYKYEKLAVIIVIIIIIFLCLKKKGLLERFENKGNVIDTLLNSYDTTDKKFNNMVDNIDLNTVTFGKSITTKKNITASGNVNANTIIASGDVKSGGVTVGGNGTIYAKKLNLSGISTYWKKGPWGSAVGKSLHYIDRQNVYCDGNDIMNGIKWYRSGNNIRTEVKCIKMVE
jgi:hypothetical protein